MEWELALYCGTPAPPPSDPGVRAPAPPPSDPGGQALSSSSLRPRRVQTLQPFLPQTQESRPPASPPSHPGVQTPSPSSLRPRNPGFQPLLHYSSNVQDTNLYPLRPQETSPKPQSCDRAPQFLSLLSHAIPRSRS
ncbi:pistil-specific extensin-like protein [Homo sapiens]|uniref:pistil-specific extensin-like protein n=1 Tax=Homo sapiens TaxID=9606 RepID=UPI001FB17200|nr:pistil-specific extensin-like protein [Homo sapiens]